MADSQKKGGANKGARLSDAERERNKKRTQARSARIAERYEARRLANLTELESLGGKIQTRIVKKWVHTTEKRGAKTIPVVKEISVEKRESPSEALARTKREAKQ